MKFLKREIRTWLFGSLVFISFPGFANLNLGFFCEQIFVAETIISGRARQARHVIQKKFADGQKNFRSKWPIKVIFFRLLVKAVSFPPSAKI